MGQIPLFPTAASTLAGQIDLLFLVLLGLSAFFTLLVVALIFYFSRKYRRGSPADRSNPPTTSFKMEMSWIFGLLFLIVGTYTWGTILYFRMTRPPENTLDIYVVGRQWMWKYQHLEGQREINTLHVPTGRPIRLILTSEDVIHSLYVPAFRLKYDAVPGRYTNLWFEATQPGEYHIFCAEFCGTDHSRMIGTIVVMEPRQFQDWLSGSPAASGASGAEGGGGAADQLPVAQAGQALFQELGCSSCHAGPGGRAPDLSGTFGTQVPLADGSTATVDENYIRESIIFPQEKIHAGYDPIMPTFEGQVSEEQVIQLITFIKTLSPGATSGESSPAGTPSVQGTTGP